MTVEMRFVPPSNENYLQMGPRQGVHIHPIQWRRAQFCRPSSGYHYRARVEPDPPTTTANPPSVVTCPHSMRRGISSVSHRSSSSCPALTFQRRQNDTGVNSGREERGLSLSLRTHAAVIQPRPHQRPPPIKTVAIHQQPYSYPDPRQIKGNVAFDLRLLELRKSEVETVRSEEARKRLLASRSKSAIPLATSWSPRQPNTWSHASTFARSGSHRASITATPADRRPSTMSPPSRKLSLPATIQYTYNDTKYARESPTVDAKSDSLSSGWNTSSSKKCITADATIAKRRPRSACSTRQKESISIAASYSFTDLLAVQKKRNSADKLTPVISEDEEILADSPQNKSCPQDGISSIEDVTLASESEKSTAPDGLLLAQEVSQGGKHSSRECQASVTFIPSQEVEPHSSNVRGDAESRELCSCLCHITVDPHLDEKTQNCSHKGDDIRAGRTTTKKEVVDCKDSCSPLPSVSQDEITLKQDQRSSDRVDELSSCDGSSKRVDLGEREARHTRHGKRKAAAKKIGSGGRSKSVTRLEPATGQQSMQSSVSTASLRSTRSSKERKRSEKKQKHASKLRK